MLALLAATAMQAADVHPLFLPTKEEMIKSYDRGGQLAREKKNIDEVMRVFCKDLGKVRSPRGQSWTAPFALLVTNRAMARMKGFNNTREYIDKEVGYKEIQALFEMPPGKKEEAFIAFRVFLYAWPGVNDYNGAINRNADQADVQRVKFVVVIDGEKALHPMVRPTLLSDFVLDGTVSIPEHHTIYGSSQGTATATGTGGTATATARSTSTVTYTTFSVGSFSAYQAVYDLQFPMFDKDGKSYFPKSVKEISLKVVRPVGEHSATFKLNDYLTK